MRLPTFTLEGKRLPRAIVSVLPSPSSSLQEITSLMKKAYQMGIPCFDLPSANHLKAFRDLVNLTEDETLLGFCHIEAEEGVSFLGKPLHRFEAKLISTLRNLLPPQLIQQLKSVGVWNRKSSSSSVSSSEVFTQKEIDRLMFDPSRFDQGLSPFRPEESPFLFLGGRYGDWLLGLGRVDLLQKMALRVREKGFIPIFLAHWTTFVLPKAKTMDVAAYAVPINRTWSLFDGPQTSTLLKKFDRPLISLNPFAKGQLRDTPEEALAFLFRELKIHATVVEMNTVSEGETLFRALEAFPSLILPRKT
jgi:hypothetical protein